MDQILSEYAVPFVALAALEVVLGIDNIVFLSILTERLEESQQPRARKIGLLLAMGMRIVLLVGIAWVMRLTSPWLAVLGHEVSGKDLVLIVGGLFLVYKSVKEIHTKLELDAEEAMHGRAAATFWGVLVQVLLLDMVFSLDSVITAVGMAKHVSVMIAAIIVAVLVMMAFAEPIAAFIKRHPTTKMLALAFLLLIGVTLVVEGMRIPIEGATIETGEGKEPAHYGIPKGYIYFAMAFALGVEVLNLWAAKARRVRQGGRDGRHTGTS